MSQNPVFGILNSKVAAVLLFGFFLLSAFYWFDAINIQSLLLVFNLSVVLIILLWERESKKKELESKGYSNDERWIRTKKNVERIDKQLDKTYDGRKRKVLLAEKSFLTNELRRIEWEIKEANINSLYNAQKGNLKRLDSRGHQNDSVENEENDKKTLRKLMNEVDSILKNEPSDSVSNALAPIANEIKAHYNHIKKRDKDSSVLSDYWVSWATILSVVNGVSVDEALVNYTSKDFRPKVIKLLKATQSLRLKEPSPTHEIYRT